MAREFGLGRLVRPADKRDWPMAPMMRHVMKLQKPSPRKRPYKEGPLLNQGDRPHCVEYSGRGFIHAAPIMTPATSALLPEFGAIYDWCQRHDEWEGENYDGTSVGAFIAWMEEKGLINAYLWGKTADDVIRWCNDGYGTALVGTEWYLRMDDVDADGYIQEPGRRETSVGGHAYRINWWDETKQAFLVMNTWGPYWGAPKRGAKNGERTGYAYMRRSLADRLFREQPEIVFPTQLKVPKPKA
jgi:hypothetical protein